jgi:N-acetyl-S-(2-succino)cysteine monooxygenase
VAHPRTMRLNAFLLGVGHHEAAWRRAGVQPGAPLTLAHYTTMAQVAEAAHFDSLFLADILSVGHEVRFNSFLQLDPLGLLCALVPATRRIGLIATASTTYQAPYDLARRLSSLDHLSGGRAGWNIVTSATTAEARNFGHLAPAPHGTRYERAGEFVAAVEALWDSWDADAFVADQAAGRYADPAGVRPIDHEGAWFTVAGPLNVPRSPQGWPLLVQAGSSEAGRAFAATHADAVFTAQDTLPAARAFADDLHARTAAAGRAPSAVSILPGVVPIVGATAAEARRRRAALDELIITDHALRQLSDMLEHDLSDLPLDAPLPAHLLDNERIRGSRGRAALVAELATRSTVREILGQLGAGRGHHVVVGTPDEVADELERWFRSGAADGFNVMGAALPEDLEIFADRVVPILRRRGLVRGEYVADTLRGHFGVERPSR